MSPKYRSVELERRRVFEEGRRLRELRSVQSKPGGTPSAPHKLIVPEHGARPERSAPWAWEWPGDPRDRLQQLEQQVAALVAERDSRVPPVRAAGTVSVLLVGFTQARTSRCEVTLKRRASKSWTLQDMQPGDVRAMYEIFYETILPGAWLIVQGPGLLSDVVAGDRICAIPSYGSSDAFEKGPRVCLRDGVLEGQQLRFNLELAP